MLINGQFIDIIFKYSVEKSDFGLLKCTVYYYFMISSKRNMIISYSKSSLLSTNCCYWPTLLQFPVNHLKLSLLAVFGKNPKHYDFWLIYWNHQVKSRWLVNRLVCAKDVIKLLRKVRISWHTAQDDVSLVSK